MTNPTEERATALGRYIVKNNATVRSTAKATGISKSTVHTDVTKRLKNADPILYGQVRKILDENKRERHLRGGMATKMKYLLLEEKQKNSKT